MTAAPAPRTKNGKTPATNGKAPNGNGQNGLTARRARAAELTGLDASRIGTINLELSQLRKLGLCVDVDVRGTSMFSVAASWADVGIADEDERHARLSPGSKYLIDRADLRELKSCETRYRQLFLQYTYDVTGFRPFRFLPYTAYQNWRRLTEAVERRFEQIKRRIIAKHPQYIESLEVDFAASAGRAWNAAIAQGFAAIEFNGKLFTDPRVFAEFIVGEARRRMPSVAEIEAGLHMDYRTAVLADDSDIEAEALAAERARAKAATIRRKELENDRLNWLANEEAKAKLEAMRAAEEEHARKQLAELGSPVDEIIGALRSQVAAEAESILTSVRANGFVRGKVAEKANGLIAFYDLMAVTKDGDLRAKLSELRSLIGPTGKARKGEAERDVAAILQTAEEIAGLARTSVRPDRVAVGRAAMLEIE